VSTDEHYFKQELRMDNIIYFPLSSLKGERRIKASTQGCCWCYFYKRANI